MFLSVIIPLYNKERCIRQTISSLLCQGFGDFEVLIINDGSTDHSREIAESFHDSRVRVINKNNEGVSTTRNIGVAEAQGDFVLFLDADDTIEENAIQHFYNAVGANADSIDVIVASFVERNAEGQIVCQCINSNTDLANRPLYELWKKRLHVRLGNFITKRKLATECGPMLSDITLYEDYEWIIRLLKIAQVKVIDKLVMSYNRSGEGLSTKRVPINKEYASRIKLGVINGDEKRVCAEHYFRRMARRILMLDFRGTCSLIKNNWIYLPYCCYVFVCARI